MFDFSRVSLRVLRSFISTGFGSSYWSHKFSQHSSFSRYHTAYTYFTELAPDVFFSDWFSKCKALFISAFRPHAIYFSSSQWTSFPQHYHFSTNFSGYVFYKFTSLRDRSCAWVLVKYTSRGPLKVICVWMWLMWCYLDTSITTTGTVLGKYSKSTMLFFTHSPHNAVSGLESRGR